MKLIKDEIDKQLNNVFFVEEKEILLREGLGKELKKARLHRNYSQSKLSKISKISQSNISKMENGTLNYSIDILERYIKSIGAKIKINIMEDYK